MKTTRLENKSRRPYNIRQANVINQTLVLHVLEIRQAEPMYGKEKIKREREKRKRYAERIRKQKPEKYVLN